MIVDNIVKPIIHYIVTHNWAWNIFSKTLVPLVGYTKRQRVKQAIDQEGFVKEISPSLAVLHGPFKGLKYNKIRSIGSTICPKILGSYEREIHTLIEEICTSSYDDIINIGCAEGFYAVGLARRIKSATVHAYDLNDEALELCNEMAELNQVSDRVQTSHLYSEESITQLNLQGKALVVCDCEGYEKEIFTEKSAPHYQNVDLLIEVHDLIDINISNQLRRLFADSHTLTVYNSVDDVQKPLQYNYEELNEFSLLERKAALAEDREAAMEWFYFSAK